MISVIVPIDIRFEYLEKCLNSILLQTYKDFEVVCVCDGETPAIEILALYVQKYDCIRYFPIAKNCAGVARNKGLDEARGEKIAFCDSDDILPRRALAYLYDKSVSSNADVVCGSFIEQYDSGSALLSSTNNQGNGFERFFSYISIWNRLYRRDFIEQHAIRFPECEGEDLLFLADVYLAKPKVAYTDKVVYQWQRHETDKKKSLTHSVELQYILQMLARWEEFFDKMAVDHQDDVQENTRATCPYLLSRISNIEDYNDRQKALDRFKPLLLKMGWEKYQFRFAKLFKTTYDTMMH